MLPRGYGWELLDNGKRVLWFPERDKLQGFTGVDAQGSGDAATSDAVTLVESGGGTPMMFGNNTLTGGGGPNSKDRLWAVKFNKTNSGPVTSANANFANPNGDGNNVASGDYSLAAGNGSQATGATSTALGSSTASGDFSISSGNASTASGTSSTALGDGCNASASYSMATGRSSSARGIIGACAHAADNYNGAGGSQFVDYPLSCRTTDATTTPATTNGLTAAANNQLVAEYNGVYSFVGQMSARTNDATLAAAWKIEGTIKRASGTLSILGTPTVTSLGADSGASSWAVAVTTDATNNALRINVTGASGKTIFWQGVLRASEC